MKSEKKILSGYRVYEETTILPQKEYSREDMEKALSWGYHTAKDEWKGIPSTGYATRFFESLKK